jgi:hypothetical protein
VSVDVRSSASPNGLRLVFLGLSPRPAGVTNQAVALDLFADCGGCPMVLAHQQFGDGGGYYDPKSGGANVGMKARRLRIDLRAENGYVRAKLYDDGTFVGESAIVGPRPETMTLGIGPGLLPTQGTGTLWIDNVLVERGDE